MQINITGAFAKVLKGMPIEEYQEIVLAYKPFASMSKTEIVAMERTIPLYKTDSGQLYGYALSNHAYLVFAFSDKNSLVLCDKIHLKDGDKFKSWTYGEVSSDNT